MRWVAALDDGGWASGSLRHSRLVGVVFEVFQHSSRASTHSPLAPTRLSANMLAIAVRERV